MMMKKSSQVQSTSINKRRNKDNLWIIKNMKVMCPSMYSLMFDELDLSRYENQSMNSKQKSRMRNKNKKPNILCFVLDKLDNLVYKDGMYYGTYMKKKSNSIIGKENVIEIYNSCQEHKYTIDINTQSFKEICDVFDHYQSVILEEHSVLMDKIDQDLEELFEMMEQKVICNTQEHTLIRNKLRGIIEKMYNSKIDLTTESYDKIDKFMKQLDSECHQSQE